jgi:hypothetical protein
MTIIEHNVETGKIVERELTAQETAQLEADQAKANQEKAQLEAIQAAKEAAQAKLAALGLTTDDLKALGL